MSLDPITLDIMWGRMIATVNEQAAALMRSSFTSIVRDAGGDRLPCPYQLHGERDGAYRPCFPGGHAGTG